MIKVTNEKGAWAIEADDLMRQVLGHGMDERIYAYTKSGGWRYAPSASQLRMETRGIASPPIRRIVNVVKGVVDEVKIQAKYNELMAMIPALEAAKAERIVAYNQEALKRAESDLAAVEEYLGALDTLKPYIKDMVENQLDNKRRRTWTTDGEHYETNAEMLVRLRLELELARKEVEG